jgi:hypothetical protein
MRRQKASQSCVSLGYGVCNEDSALGSSENDVLLVAEDQLPEDRFHIYQVYVPSSFISVRGRRGLTVALAFDPPVRASRRDYLGRTMWLEAYKGLATGEVENYRRHHRGTDAPTVPQSKLLDLGPSKTTLQWSTLQVRRKIWSRSPQLPIISDLHLPIIHLLVGCQSRFRTDDPEQKYALAVRLWHEGEPLELRLYQELRTRVRVRAPIRVQA